LAGAEFLLKKNTPKGYLNIFVDKKL